MVKKKLNKLVILMLLLISCIISVNAYDINEYTDIQTDIARSVSSQSTFPKSVLWNDDGSKMFITDVITKEMYMYSCSVAYSPADCSGGFLVFDTTADGYEGSQSITIANNGSNLYFYTYLMNETTMEFDFTGIVGYSCTTPYDFETCTLQSTLDTTGLISDVYGLEFSLDGTKLYTASNSGNKITEFTTSTPFDISTYSVTGNYVFSNETANSRNLKISNDGSKAFVLSLSPVYIYQYNMATAFDISTMYYSGNSLDISTYESTPFGFDFSYDETRLFIVGSGTDTVYVYDYLMSNTVTIIEPIETTYTYDTEYLGLSVNTSSNANCSYVDINGNITSGDFSSTGGTEHYQLLELGTANENITTYLIDVTCDFGGSVENSAVTFYRDAYVIPVTFEIENITVNGDLMTNNITITSNDILFEINMNINNTNEIYDVYYNLNLEGFVELNGSIYVNNSLDNTIIFQISNGEESTLSDFYTFNVESEDDTPTTSGGSSGGSYQPATEEMDSQIENIIEEDTNIQAFSFFNEDGELDFSQVESISTKTGIPYSDVGTGIISFGGLSYITRKFKYNSGKSKKAKKQNLITKILINLVLSGVIYVVGLSLINTFM